jgi:hypothetical protein
MGEMYDSGELKKLFEDAGILGADS